MQTATFHCRDGPRMEALLGQPGSGHSRIPAHPGEARVSHRGAVCPEPRTRAEDSAGPTPAICKNLAVAEFRKCSCAET